jgi:outer membrane protein
MEEQKNQITKKEKSVNLKPLYIINGILAVAIILIFILHFVPHGSKTDKKTAPDGSGMNIAFVNSDSIFQNYQFVIDKREFLVTKTQELQTDLENQQKNFQYQLNDYQNKVKSNTISIAQATQTEENLGMMQQNIMLLEQQYSEQLQQLEYDIQIELIERLMNYLKEHNADKQWDYILGYTFGGGVLYANPDYDLTVEVLTELNKRYSEEAPSEVIVE